MMHVFISYSRKDIAVMHRVRDDLQREGLETWDDEEIQPGTPSWKDAIEQAIDIAGCLIVILSPNAKKSIWVRREIDYAVAQKVPIFPVIASGNEAESIPFELINYQYIDITNDYNKNILNAASAISKHVKLTEQQRNQSIPNPRVLKGSSRAVANTLTAHEKHTATLLSDGQVLIIGGNRTNHGEIFDPDSQSFRPTGAMGANREWGHSALLMPDGKVLVIGGSCMTVQTNANELYDPDRNEFVWFGEINLPRENHVAILLGSEIWIIGGYGTWDTWEQDPVNNSVLSEIEVFDMQINESVHKEGMSKARVGHTGTQLQDGKVLIVGGISSSRFNSPSSALKTVEILDTKGNNVISAGSLIEGRTNHTATRLGDGRVLIVGGHGGTYTPLKTAELYDPSTGIYSDSIELNTARHNHSAVLLSDGEVVVMGGNGNSLSEPLASVEIFDPNTNRFYKIEPMNHSRTHHTSTLLQDGSILVVGGIGEAQAHSAELYQCYC